MCELVGFEAGIQPLAYDMPTRKSPGEARQEIIRKEQDIL